MRVAPITALVVLSAEPRDDAKELFRRAFPKVIQTPGDLQDCLRLCRNSALRGMGKAITRAAGRWLAGMSQYHAIKYGSESQEMSLRDMYRMVRPKLTGAANALARYLVKGEAAPELTQVCGYEAFKRAARAFQQSKATLTDEERSTVEARLLALIEEHRLPWEVVTAQVESSRAVWEAMVRQMPYMACLAEVTPVWLPDGTTAPIEDVVEHRLPVLSFNKAWDTRPVQYGHPLEPQRDHEVGHLVSKTPS